MRIKGEICNKCLGTGQFYNGEEYEECTECDGPVSAESLDTIIDLDDIIEDPEDHDDSIDNW